MNKLYLFILSIFSINLVSAQNIDIAGQARGLLGGFSLNSVWSILSWGLLILVIVAVVAFFLQQSLMNKKFNKSITFFKRNPFTGSLVADQTIKAMTTRLDSWGNLGYRLKRPYETRNLIPKLKYEAKTNVHYVEYCEDGRLVEIIGFGDYDDERKKINAKFSDHNTELARSSMHTSNSERYDKKKFWTAENISTMVQIGTIVVILVFLWLIADKLIDVVNSIGNLLDQAGTLQEAQSNIIDSLNRLLSSNNLNPTPIDNLS